LEMASITFDLNKRTSGAFLVSLCSRHLSNNLRALLRLPPVYAFSAFEKFEVWAMLLKAKKQVRSSAKFFMVEL